MAPSGGVPVTPGGGSEQTLLQPVGEQQQQGQEGQQRDGDPEHGVLLGQAMDVRVLRIRPLMRAVAEGAVKCRELS
jgi:hypothetical protein